MADVYYDFSAATNGSGADESDPRNTWATPSNGDVILLRPGVTWTRATQVTLTASNLTFRPWPSYYDNPALGKPRIAHSAASTFVWSFTGDGVHTVQDLLFEDCSSNANGAMLGCGTVVATSVGAQLRLLRVDFRRIAHHAVRMSATTTAASPTFYAEDCTWDQIGEDAIYGGALDYRVIGGWMRRLSQANTNGDGIGFLDVTPNYALVRGVLIDHSDVDSKHCIIFDVPSAGTGLAYVEDCTLIGYSGGAAESHTVLNGDCVIHSRRNKIITYGIGINFAGAGSTSKNDVVIARNVRGSSPQSVALQANNCDVDNLAALVDYTRTVTHRAVEVAAGVTGARVRNSAFRGFSAGVRHAGAAAGVTPTNNGFQDCDEAYSSASGTITSTGDVTGDLMMTAEGRPHPNSPLLTGGANLGYRPDIRGARGRGYIGAWAPNPVRAYVNRG